MTATRRATLLVVATACVVNLGALRPGFIHDDHRIIEQNELIRSLTHLPGILSHGYWSVGDADVPILYRPVTILSFALNHAIGGLRPFGYRLCNLLLHACVSLLVYRLGRRLLAAPRDGWWSDPALPAALLFAVHPIHTEVLGEVVGRAELLAAAGTLVSVLLFLRARDSEGGARGGVILWSSASVVAFGFAFLAKENAVVVPFLALLADRLLVRRRPAWRLHLAMAAVLLAGLGARVQALGALIPPGQVHFVDNPIAFAPFLQGRLTALAVLARYALLLAVPLRQSIDYSFDAIPVVSSGLDAGALCGALLVAALLAGLAWAWRRSASAAFCLGWIVLTLLPVANLLLPIGTIMAERLLYLPSAGVCLLAGLGLDRRARRDGASQPAGPDRGPVAPSKNRGLIAPRTLVASLVLLAMAGRSVARLEDWRDDQTIFRSALRVVPDSVRALYNYGAACEDRGEDAEAERVYRRAVTIWPDFADAHFNLAGVLARRRVWSEAVTHYRESLRLKPGSFKTMVNLGHALIAEGHPEAARDMLGRAVEIEPGSVEAYTNLGAAALALKDAAGAVSAYSEAARLDPSNADYQRNLALAQAEAGDPGAAAESYRRGLALRPGDPDLLTGLGMARLQSGDAPGAVQALEESVRIRPGHPIARYQLGRALERAGRNDEAAAQYRESARLSPSSPVPLRALGLLLAKTGDRDGAAQALENAAALDPEGRVMDEAARRTLRSLQTTVPKRR